MVSALAALNLWSNDAHAQSCQDFKPFISLISGNGVVTAQNPDVINPNFSFESFDPGAPFSDAWAYGSAAPGTFLFTSGLLFIELPALVGYEAFPGGPLIADVELELVHFYSPNNGAVTVWVLDDSLNQLDKQSYAPSTTINEGDAYLLNFTISQRAKYLAIETVPSEVGMFSICVD